MNVKSSTSSESPPDIPKLRSWSPHPSTVRPSPHSRPSQEKNTAKKKKRHVAEFSPFV